MVRVVFCLLYFVLFVYGYLVFALYVVLIAGCISGAICLVMLFWIISLLLQRCVVWVMICVELICLAAFVVVCWFVCVVYCCRFCCLVVLFRLLIWLDSSSDLLCVWCCCCVWDLILVCFIACDSRFAWLSLLVGA